MKGLLFHIKILKRPEYLWPGFIFSVALVLRLMGLDHLSFSNDELSALYRTEFNNLDGLIREGVIPDFHPAGVQIFLYYWTDLVGMSEFWVRLPFALFGALSVLLVYNIGRRWFGVLPGLVAACLLAVLEFPLLYAIIARPYATGLFFILLVAWFWTRFVLDGAAMKPISLIFHALGFSLSLAACMYNHYFSFLLAAIIGISGLWKLRGRIIRVYIGAGVLAVLLFLPHLPITLAHFSIGGLSTWLGKPGNSWVFDHWVHIFNKSIWMWLPALIATAFALMKALRSIVRSSLPLTAFSWWFLPLIIGWTYSTWVNPVLQHSILLFGFPFLLILLAYAFEGVNLRHSHWIVPLLLCLGLVHLLLISRFFERQHFADFRGSGMFMLEVLENKSLDGTAWAINTNNPWYVDHYLGGKARDIEFLTTDIRDMAGLKSFLSQIDSTHPSSIIYVSLKPEPRELIYALTDRFPGMRVFQNTDDCSWYAWFDKEATPSALYLPKPDTTINMISPKLEGGQSKEGLSPENANEASMFLDRDQEFGSTLEIPLASFRGLTSMHASVEACMLEDQGDPQLVVTIEDKAGTTVFWRSSSFRVFTNTGSWGKVHLFIDGQALSVKGEIIKIYVWNHGQQPLYWRNCQVNIAY